MSTQIESLGITILKGYKSANLATRPDFAIIGNVISASNEEAQEVVRLGVPYTSLASAMGDFIIGDRQSIVISGTHGKTTTTSLMSWVATELGVKPGFLIGGIPKNFSNSFKNPDGDFFIIEGDEYDTAYFDKVPKFIHYRPRHVIFTSCEFDHADIYKDFDAVKAAFGRLMMLIPEDGTLVYWGDDANVSNLAKTCGANRVLSYGLVPGHAYSAVKKSVDTFEVLAQGRSLGVFRTPMPGDYNLLNALAVIALSHSLGWDLAIVKKALMSFEGVKRRQEILGEPRGITVIEDFAHHPTAVRETIKGIRNKYSGRRIWAIFEPRSATSRRKVFQKDYVTAFSEADEVILAQAFDQSKIDEGDRFSSEELVSDLQSKGVHAQVFAGADAIVTELRAKAKPQDVLLIMSNGGFDNIYTKLLKQLE